MGQETLQTWANARGDHWQIGTPTATEPGCAHARPVRISYAQLLKRVFEIDMQHCPNCGGELKIIAAILEAAVSSRIRIWQQGESCFLQ